MRIVRYFPRAWRGDGGITTSVRRISRELVRAGADVRVAVDEPRISPNGDDGFAWTAVPHVGASRFRRPVDLGRHLSGADVLVLHSAWTYHNNHAAAIARKLRLPYILEPRGAYDPFIVRRRKVLKRAWWLAFEQRLVREAAAIHVFFPSQRDHLRALGYQGPVLVAPNGVVTPRGLRWDGGSGEYVLWIGRFDPEHKGLDLLLHALRVLPPIERPELRLHGPDWAGGKPRTERLIRELRLNDWVRVGDPVYGDEKWDLISRASAFTYPSRWEGFGNSTAEAVAAGVPTLVTPYPLGRWLAERGAAVMGEASPTALAEGLRRVLSPDAAKAGQRGRALLRNELSWNAVARSWLQQAEAVV